jgi:ABC-type dipeptide/oligopeptide/nickel transport system permease component
MTLPTYILRRIFGLLPILLGLSFLVFLMLRFVPGDPAVVVAGIGASGEDIDRIREQLGLDRSWFDQYAGWLSGLIRGDWGNSIASREAVLPLVLVRFQSTILLAGIGMLLAVSIAIPLGVVAALRPNSIQDLSLTAFALLGVSAPVFWIGLLLQLVFAIILGWLPATGSGTFWHLLLPAVTIGGNSVGVIMRMTRSSLLETLNQDFIRTARAKGLGGLATVYRHALRPALVPIVTVIGLQFAYLMGGAVLTETVFVWPGIGKLLADAIFRRDFPVVQGAILLIGSAFVVVNLLTDLAYGIVDPRVRFD